MISAKSWAHLKVFLNFILEFLFFHCENQFAILVASVSPSSLVSSTARIIATSFLKWMIDVISFCLYLVNEMRRNLIKIASHAIFRWFNCFDRFSQ